MEWYHVDDIDQVDSPALLVYKQRVEENVRLLTGMVDDVNRLRPHVKTHKCSEAVLLQLQAGITKFKCATIAEAEMLAGVHAPDVLLAYQPVVPKLRRFVQLIKSYPHTSFACVADNPMSAEAIAAAAREADIQINIFVDVNLGMNRTGVLVGEDTITLYQHCMLLQGIHIKGFHAYDGHLHMVDMQERTMACNAAFKLLEEVCTRLHHLGYPTTVIVAGGSPSFPIHALRPGVECSPGTFIYWDFGYMVNCPEQPFIPAALVISRVISAPTADTLCLDLGHKSVASENIISKRIHFLNAPDLVVVGHSEEHLVVKTNALHDFKIGDVLYGIPYHICPTVALYKQALLVENNTIACQWEITARDRKINV